MPLVVDGAALERMGMTRKVQVQFSPSKSGAEQTTTRLLQKLPDDSKSAMAEKPDLQTDPLLDKSMAITAMLVLTLEMIGGELTPPALLEFVDNLIVHEMEEVVPALKICAREVKGRLALKDVLDRMSVAPVRGGRGAEGLAAWAFVLNIKKHHLRRKPAGDGPEAYEFCSHTLNDWERYPEVRRGNVGALLEAHWNATGRREVPCRTIPCPAIPQRTNDSVVRSGGWARVAGMLPEEVTWAQKDFLAQYSAWDSVEVARAALPASGPAALPPSSVRANPLPEEFQMEIRCLSKGKTMDGTGAPKNGRSKGVTNSRELLHQQAARLIERGESDQVRTRQCATATAEHRSMAAD
jgi:hypothetical protein